MKVVLRVGEQVWVYQQSHLTYVEGAEELADGRDPDLLLVEHTPLLHQEDAVGDGGVGVGAWVVVEAHHVAPAHEVEENWRQKGEEADYSTEHRLQGQTFHSQSGLQEDLWREEQADPTGGVGETLYSCSKHK